MEVKISESAVKEAAKKLAQHEAVVTDSLGRALTIKKLDIVSESRLVRMLGQEAVTNQVYMNGYVLPAIMVRKIDGEDIFIPNSIREMEALLQQLGNEGIAAVLDHIHEETIAMESSEEQLKN